MSTPVLALIAITFSIALALFFIVRRARRWVALLVCSYGFYLLWGIPSVIVLLFCTGWTYLVGIRLAREVQQGSRNASVILTIGIGLNLLLLFVFKYLSTLLESLSIIPGPANPFSLVQPVGISYFSFKCISYLIDVHDKKLQPERHLGYWATYVAFFPQIIAGPIERASSFLPQLRENPPFDESLAVEGLRAMLWGAFKKVVIADQLGLYVNVVFSNPQGYTGPHFVLATIFFAVQLYCDFSGYTDVANGMANFLGFKATPNFRQPYFSTSVREFWQRWHISFSNWIRDYLFLPLARKSIKWTGGRFPRLTQTAVNLAVMGLVGLWHGANLTFVVWGLVHGAYLSIESWLRRPTKPAAQQALNALPILILRSVFTFGLVCLGWIFFRANSIQDAIYILTHLGNVDIGTFQRFSLLRGLSAPLGSSGSAQMETIAALLAVLAAVDILDSWRGIHTLLNKAPAVARWVLYYAVSIGILILGFSARQQFIYFKF